MSKLRNRGQRLNPAQRPIRQQPTHGHNDVLWMVASGMDKAAAETFIEIREHLELSIGVSSLSVAS